MATSVNKEGDVLGGASRMGLSKGKTARPDSKKSKAPLQGKPVHSPSRMNAKGSRVTVKGMPSLAVRNGQMKTSVTRKENTKSGQEGEGKLLQGELKADFSKGNAQDNYASGGGEYAKQKVDRKAQKELAEQRKKLRKPNFDLEKEALAVWELIRMRNTKPEQRKIAITTLLGKIKGKLVDLASSPAASRVIQTCFKHCTDAERTAIFEEVRPHCLTLACNTYGHHLVKKVLDNASKQQRQQIFSAFHSHVVELLRHPSGSAVLEQAYQLANATEKNEMAAEFYSEEFRLFKGISGSGRLADVWESAPPTKRGSILQHMAMALQPILEKGIVDHTIIHRVVAEYLSIAGKGTVKEVVEQLSGTQLVRMIHTKEGCSIGIKCVSLGTAKDRKKIVKGMKGNVMKVACDDHGHLVLLRIFDVVDDTLLVRKVIISELLKGVEELAVHKHGRKVLLHLLAPRVPRYFPPSVLSALEPTQPLSASNAADVAAETAEEGAEEPVKKKKKRAAKGVDADDSKDEDEEGGLGVSKKDPEVRRFELLGPSGLAKMLAQVCAESAGKLLRSSTGTDVIYEVASGGADGIMWRAVPDMVPAVHTAIAMEAALSKEAVSGADGEAAPPQPAKRKRPRVGTGKAAIQGLSTEDAIAVLQGHADPDAKAGTEHVLEQWYASRTIRRLVVDAPPPPADVPPFAAVLWGTALKGNCKTWAHGHSAKVVAGMWNCRHEPTRQAVRSEVQPLIQSGELNDVANLFVENGSPKSAVVEAVVLDRNKTPKAVEKEKGVTPKSTGKKQKRDRS